MFFVTGGARANLLVWLRVPDETWTMLLAEGRRGPTCCCGAVMQTAPLKGVSVDGCSSCGGLLLDPGELKRLTGLEERTPAATATTDNYVPVHGGDLSELGRVYVPARQALEVFVQPRSFHLLQVKSEVGGGILGVPVNQPFQWTLSNGRDNGLIGPDDESAARQLLAFVTGNLVSSRFCLRDGRENPMLVFVRRSRALVKAHVDVLVADDEAPLGEITKSVVGLALDISDARGRPALRFEKRLGDIWGFTVVDPGGRPIGDVARGFSTLEVDTSLLGGIDMGRSVRRDDFQLQLDDAVSPEHTALALAATFLVAHTSSGPAGITAFFD